MILGYLGMAFGCPVFLQIYFLQIICVSINLFHARIFCKKNKLYKKQYLSKRSWTWKYNSLKKCRRRYMIETGRKRGYLLPSSGPLHSASLVREERERVWETERCLCVESQCHRPDRQIERERVRHWLTQQKYIN